MTDEKGNMLPACAANLATLFANWQAVGTRITAMEVSIDAVQRIVIEHSVVVDGLKSSVDDKLIPAIESLKQSIPGMIHARIKEHENTDPIHKGFRKKLNRKAEDATNQFFISSPPPHEDAVVDKERKIAKYKWQQVIAGLILLGGSLLGGMRIESCSGQSTTNPALANQQQKE